MNRLASGNRAGTGYRQSLPALLYGGPASVGRIAQLVEQLTLNWGSASENAESDQELEEFDSGAGTE
jgi:hypothetical protein